jgi:hypothetical protein
MDFDGPDQQVRIAGTLLVDFVVGHDLVFGLLQFHHLAELVRLAGLAFADESLGTPPRRCRQDRPGPIRAWQAAVRFKEDARRRAMNFT